MTDQQCRRLLAVIAAVLMASSVSALTVGAAPPSATVVGTAELEIRSCPRTSCAVVAAAPLGASVAFTDQVARDDTSDDPATGQFLPVRYEGKAGYAQDLFLAINPAHAPYLLRGQEGCKRVALIFNIGVGFDPATGILDTLEAKQVPATMFVMGWWADKHPAILKRMVDEGYPIGSHGYDAVELTTRPDEEVASDIQEATSAIEHAAGKPPAPYFTPYAAAIDERVRADVAAAGYLPVAWTVAAEDYGPDATEDAVYDNIMDNIDDGAIVELHLDGPASAESTGRALPRVIDELRDQGYRFVTIPELAQPCPESGVTPSPG